MAPARLPVVLRLLLAVGLLATAAGPAHASPQAPSATPAGTELYGYLPYWEMTASMADYLAGVPLTTLALFSVTAADSGGLAQAQTGYRRIRGAIGQRLIAEAHARGQRVELVFTSFGFEVNDRRFLQPRLANLSGRRPDDAMAALRRIRPLNAPWQRTARELVALVAALGLDGIDVDVELLSTAAVDGYARFVRALRTRLAGAVPGARLTAATMASGSGANLARVAIDAGVDRVFLMGYDYHWSGSDPGASAPLDRLDGGASLRSSIAAYAAAGVPPERTLLGLPLFGMSWPVASADIYAPRLGGGVAWIPSNHTGFLTGPGAAPYLAWPEMTEFVASPASGGGWRAIFYDSPRTLRPKLVLARASGFAGAGFWAIGYERGLPGYLELMRAFVSGAVEPEPSVGLRGP